jgi:hypothetical protein
MLMRRWLAVMTTSCNCLTRDGSVVRPVSVPPLLVIPACMPVDCRPCRFPSSGKGKLLLLIITSGQGQAMIDTTGHFKTVCGHRIIGGKLWFDFCANERGEALMMD